MRFPPLWLGSGACVDVGGEDDTSSVTSKRNLRRLSLGRTATACVTTFRNTREPPLSTLVTVSILLFGSYSTRTFFHESAPMFFFFKNRKPRIVPTEEGHATDGSIAKMFCVDYSPRSQSTADDNSLAKTMRIHSNSSRTRNRDQIGL